MAKPTNQQSAYQRNRSILQREKQGLDRVERSFTDRWEKLKQREEELDDEILQINNERDRIDGTQRELERLRAPVDKEREKLNKRASDLDAKQKELEALEKPLIQEETQFNKRGDEINAAQNKLKQEEAKLLQEESRFDKRQDELNKTQDRLKQEQSKLLKEQAKFDERRKALNTAQQKINKMYAEILAVKDKRSASYNKKVEEYNRLRQQNNYDIDSLNRQITAFNQKQTEFNQQWDANQNDIILFNQQIAGVQEKRDEFNKKWDANQQDIRLFNQQAAVVQKRRDEFNQKWAANQHEISEYNKQSIQLSKIEAEHDQKWNENQREIKAFNERYEKYRQKKDKYNADALACNQDYQKYETDLKKHEEKVCQNCRSVISTGLYQGQTSHPITAEEMSAFLDKIIIETDDNPNAPKKEKREKILAALKHMAEYPTGREQMRAIIQSDQGYFKIVCNAQGDIECQKRDAAGFNDGRKSTLSSKQLNDPEYLKQAGYVLLHEMLHQRQKGSSLPENLIVLDMETQALNRQLYNEFGWNGLATSYMESYKLNEEKWRNIMDGKEPKPEWAPPFIPKAGLSAAKIQEARNEYIRQMASQTTNAQFIEDFVISRAGMKDGRFSMPVGDYNGLKSHIFYDSDNISQISFDKQDFNLTPESVAYLKKNYPALNIEKVQRNLQELAGEYQLTQARTQRDGSNGLSISDIRRRRPQTTNSAQQSTVAGGCTNVAGTLSSATLIPPEVIDGQGNDLIYINIHSDAVEAAQKHPVSTELENLDKNQGNRTTNELSRLKFDLVAGKEDLDTNAKLYLLSGIINHHKACYPDKDSPEGRNRAEMINELREMTGLWGLPIVVNEEDNLMNHLRSNSDNNILIQENESEISLSQNETRMV